MGRRRARAALVLCVVMVLGACGDDEPVPDGADGFGRVADGDYIATAVTEGGVPQALIEGTTIRLRLDDGSLSAHAGCNTIGGEFRVDDDVFHVDAVSMTEMGCGQAYHDQDEWLAEFLSASPTLGTIGDGFALRAENAEITFVNAAAVEPAVELIGTTWVVDGYVEGSDPESAVSSASDAGSLVFGANGFVSGDDGCNSFGFAGEANEPPTQGLRYEADGDAIMFDGSAVVTDKACPGRDVDRFWAVLSGTVSWRIDGSRLTLRDGSGRGVSYSAKG